MKLIDLFLGGENQAKSFPDEPMNPADALKKSFGLLSGGNEKVTATIADCLSDTRKYYSSHSEWLEKHGLQYSAEAEPWLCVIAAVESCVANGLLHELKSDCTADEFITALKAALRSAGIVFSPANLTFDSQKSLAAWTRQFNEYAGQSGITLYFVDLYSEELVMGAALIADYAEAAETAGFAGLKITSRPG